MLLEKSLLWSSKENHSETIFLLFIKNKDWPQNYMLGVVGLVKIV